jgi:2-polyprenyl-3-methyl-5-hydroxy-6-metoxy-1,4-benzoquinol methylase
MVRLAGREWGVVPLPLSGRRFCWRLSLTGADGCRRQRLTGHYVAVSARSVDADYFQGTNYVDHDAQSSADHRQVVDILQREHARGPVLEIGCATGGLLVALDAIGLPSVGIDMSPWAVDRARHRVGAGRAWVCDVERDPLPADIKSRSPFGALVLAAVLEHFRHPFAVLAELTAIAAPGAHLIITTTNADSLTHTLFGSQWEGYSDWTHLGIDRVRPSALRDELPRLGWRVVELTTHGVWDASADPVRATLRDWWVADARFRRFLTERDLGDLIKCVAVKT